jgi:ferredoxin
MVASMRANVDKDLCIGCGLCAEICPEVFEMGDDMIALVIAGEIPAGSLETARDAAAACPVEAIALA